MPTNAEIARLLHEIAVLTELEEGSRQSFRARAYHNAVRAIEGHPRDVTELAEGELTAIKGVGKAIAAKVREFADTGAIAKLEQLRERYPPGYVELVRVPGIGPKTVALLYEHLGIASLDDLRTALAAGALRDLPGLGERTEANLVAAIEKLGMTGKERRTPIADALPIAEDLVEHLSSVEGVERVVYAGSLRRFRESIADVDIVVAATRPQPVMEAFTHLAMVREVLAQGDTKASVVTARGLQIDLRVVTAEQFGAALQYFTGSQEHNIQVRERALKRAMTLNEYGLFEIDEEGAQGALVASATEEEVYAALDLDWIPPGMREGVGEVESAAAHELPELATIDDIRGDLHVHTDLSGDGRNTLEEMVDAAVARGYRYLGITDHAEDLRINGATREQMLAQRERIVALNDQLAGTLRLLHGAELNIGEDGGLDYDHDFLMGYDWTVASVHSHFKLDRGAQTERVITAMRHPAVSCIGHLQGRRVGKRPGIDLDIDAVLEVAAETGTGIEINSNLDRLDATADVCRAARGRDVTFVINTDSHRIREFDYVRHGLRQAERGWVPRERVANTWELERFLAWVAAKRA